MSFDSISISSIPAASKAKFLAKEKLGKKSAELKQDKLDLSQVKNEGCEEEPGKEIDVPLMNVHKGRDQATRPLGVTSYSDLSSNSPSSGTFFSRPISEVEDGDGLDDWEAVADALAAADDEEKRDQKIESLAENEIVTRLDHLPEVVKQPAATVDFLKQKSENHDRKFKSGVENVNVTKLDQPTATKDFRKPKPEKGQEGRHGDAFRWKPKPEDGQAWRSSDALSSKPRPENGQAWRNHDASHWKQRPKNGQAWRNHVSFQCKPKPENSQAWRSGDAFCWKPKPEKRDQKSTSLVENKIVTQLDHLLEVVNQPTAIWKPKPENAQATVDILKPDPENAQARRRGDALLPKTLPYQQKKHNYPMEANRQYRPQGTKLGCKNFVSPPSSCPICCEDLDSTDSSFLPCSCGFQLCLFCHKRILEEDGRCPGCRKHYDKNAVQWAENPDLIVA